MRREDIRAFLKAGADAIPTYFESGRLTEFNSMPNKSYPFAWLESLEVDTDFSEAGGLIDAWAVKIHIAKLDKIDSLADAYEGIIDECDHIARQLLWQYNVILYGATTTTAANKTLYKLIQLSNVSREPFVKKHADCVTGIELSFTLTTPDQTDVCP